MSDAWGPRAHPERCDDDMRCSEEAYREEWPKVDAMRRSERILTWICVITVVGAAFVWLTAKWGW